MRPVQTWYDFRSVSIQMLLTVYMKPVWKIFSCRFHSFRLLNRHEWLGPVWSRSMEPCKHELIWDRSESVRDHCFDHAQECCWTIPRWRITGKRLKKIKLVGFLGIQWFRIWLKHWKHQRLNMKVEVLTSKEILWSCIQNYKRQCQSRKYEETDFGPTAVSEQTKSIEEMSKEHKKNADAINNKRHNEADHKRKIGTSCMFHVNIYADLNSRTGLV